MKFVNDVMRILNRNSPVILSGTAITGVVTTAYLASRASVQASSKIERFESLELTHDRTRREKLIHDVKLVWTGYIPAVASGGVTIFCIVASTRVTNKRAAAAQAAFVLSERAYAEYRNKVLDEYGESKEQKIRDSIVEDRVRNNPPTSGNVIVAGSGTVLCCELYTGRYFSSDMETLRRAANDINYRLVRHDSASLEDLYDLLGLPPTSTSADIGWNSDKPMELEFTSVLTEDGKPCLAFNYNYTRPLFEGMFR